MSTYLVPRRFDKNPMDVFNRMRYRYPVPVLNRPFEHVSLDLITDLPDSHGYNTVVVTRVGLNGPWRVAERVQLIPGKGGCLQLNDSAVRVQLNFQLNDCSAERSAERSAEQTEHDETDRLNG